MRLSQMWACLHSQSYKQRPSRENLTQMLVHCPVRWWGCCQRDWVP